MAVDATPYLKLRKKELFVGLLERLKGASKCPFGPLLRSRLGTLLFMEGLPSPMYCMTQSGFKPLSLWWGLGFSGTHSTQCTTGTTRVSLVLLNKMHEESSWNVVVSSDCMQVCKQTIWPSECWESSLWLLHTHFDTLEHWMLISDISINLSIFACMLELGLPDRLPDNFTKPSKCNNRNPSS